MKTSRREDWIVVVGVVIAALALAVFFLVRNKSGETNSSGKLKSQLEEITVYSQAETDHI